MELQKNHTYRTVREAAILTDSYVAGTVIDELKQYNQISLLIEYTEGSLDSFELLIEYSYDGVTYFQDANITPSAGVNTLTPANYTYASGDANIVVDFPINCNYMRVSAKGTGTATGSSLAIKAIPAFV